MFRNDFGSFGECKSLKIFYHQLHDEKDSAYRRRNLNILYNKYFLSEMDGE